MKTQLKIMLVTFLILFTASICYSQSAELAEKYYNAAQELAKQGKHLEAAQMFAKSAQAEAESPQPRQKVLAVILNNAGNYYIYVGQYDQAIKYLKEALAIDRKLGAESDIAIVLNNIGSVYKAWGQYDQAIKHYEQALAILRKLGQEDKIAVSLNYTGLLYYAWGRYDQALKYYEQALAIDRKLGREGDIARDLTNIGLVYKTWGQYDQALEYYEQALAISQELGQEDRIASYLNNIGLIYDAWGEYNQAIKYYEEALAINRKLGREGGIARDLNNIGYVYNTWGQYDQAVKYYEQALAILRKLGQEDKIAISLNNIGLVYMAWGQYDQALKYYEQALAILRKLGQEDKIAVSLNNIGLLYDAWGRYDQALKYYEQALAINRKLGRKRDIARDLNNIGGVYVNWGQYDQVLKHFKEALAISRKLGTEDYITDILNNIGWVYYELKEYTKAIENFENSIEIKEKLRKTATGDIRRDYLASQIYTYQLLTSASIRYGDYSLAFNSIELSRAKLLAERLARSESAMNIPSVEQIQKELPDNTALMVYANASWEDKVLIALTREMIYGLEVSDKDFLSAALGKYETSVQTMLKNQRGMKKIVREEKEVLLKGPVEEKDDFENLINYYRMLLTNPTRENNEKAQELGRVLYNFLIKPMAEQIQDKKELIILPDGVLGFLPFETLIDNNGAYLAENYNITYAQSMVVLELIRSRQYKESRKPLLALGGAVYDEMAYAVDMVENEKQLAYLEKNIYSAFKSRGSVRNTYASLGVGDWGNLPGSLSEVKAIKKAVNGAEVITGGRVTESEIKALSNSGKLAEYKVLHFATHGLVVPAVPELSALVLSQFREEKGNEDGYLRMGEIAELDIQADFVNLSACETGLGKIYGGEGVVGLTQSFLIAGANGLSVSLWQVADVSTSRFMVAMYESVQDNSMGYADAITQTKRRFIKGDFGEKYRAPYYWAPFVYYGR